MLLSDKISLRKLEPRDLPFLYQWENDTTAWAMSDTHNPLSQKDLRDYIESSTGDIYRDGQLRLIIESNSLNEDAIFGEIHIRHAFEHQLTETDLRNECTYSAKNKLTLGSIDIFDFDPHNSKAALGLYVAPYARRHGVGRAAVHLLEDYAFRFLGLRMLYVFIPELNIPSLALFSCMNWETVATLPLWLRDQSVIVMQKKGG